MIDKIKASMPFGDDHTTRFIIHRNRGNHYPPDFVWGSRYKPDDGPDYYKLETGERLPALPYDYITNDQDGNPTVKLIEADDSQYIAFKTLIDPEVKDADSLQELDIDVDTEYEDEAADLLKDDETEFDPVSFCVLDDRDERKTFLSDELKTKDDKYEGNGLAAWLADNTNIVMVVGVAVALAILYTQMGGAIMEFIKMVESGELGRQIASQIGSSPPG